MSDRCSSFSFRHRRPGVADTFRTHRGCMVNFTDSQLQKCYERNFAEVADLCVELRQVSALIAAHDLFRLMEGPHSVRVHEVIERLLLPVLRPVLRSWYQRPGADMNSEEVGLRDQLSQLA